MMGEWTSPHPAVQRMSDKSTNNSIIWDNGNEGGWNTNLDADFERPDPQHRAVNHP
jgi:hypothetical protein